MVFNIIWGHANLRQLSPNETYYKIMLCANPTMCKLPLVQSAWGTSCLSCKLPLVLSYDIACNLVWVCIAISAPKATFTQDKSKYDYPKFSLGTSWHCTIFILNHAFMPYCTQFDFLKSNQQSMDKSYCVHAGDFHAKQLYPIQLATNASHGVIAPKEMDHRLSQINLQLNILGIYFEYTEGNLVHPKRLAHKVLHYSCLGCTIVEVALGKLSWVQQVASRAYSCLGQLNATWCTQGNLGCL